MDPEGGGVLNNLPRSRPGTRSDKRGPGAERPTSSARPSTPPSESARDPVGGALRAAAGAAGAGMRVAGAVSREVLRRLPRP